MVVFQTEPLSAKLKKVYNYYFWQSTITNSIPKFLLPIQIVRNCKIYNQSNILQYYLYKLTLSSFSQAASSSPMVLQAILFTQSTLNSVSPTEPSPSIEIKTLDEYIFPSISHEMLKWCLYYRYIQKHCIGGMYTTNWMFVTETSCFLS